jgi:hypothetical protein
VDAPQNLDSDDESEDPDYIPEEGEDDTYTGDVAQDFVVELIEEGFITPGVEGPIEEENIEESMRPTAKADMKMTNKAQTKLEIRHPTKNPYRESQGGVQEHPHPDRFWTHQVGASLTHQRK